MKVLDTTFLIDYLDGVEATREFYEGNGGADTRWVVPVPALAEILVGEGNLPNGDVAGAHADLTWGEIHPSDEKTAVTAGQIADEIPSVARASSTASSRLIGQTNLGSANV